jgi:hypothetical protein
MPADGIGLTSKPHIDLFKKKTGFRKINVSEDSLNTNKNTAVTKGIILSGCMMTSNGW